MKLIRIVIGLIGVLGAVGRSSQGEEGGVVDDEQPILVHDLTRSEDWNAAMQWAQNKSDLPEDLLKVDEMGGGVEKHLLVTFYAPWCGHCKRMIPNMLDASHHFRTWQQKDLVRFGRVDCTTAKKRCANYGVYSYPTILWIDSHGGLVAEFPAGPRSSEAILSFVASEMRPKEAMPTDLSSFERIWDEIVSPCRQPSVNPSASRSYFMHLCKANAIHNTILGDDSAIKKLEEVLPKINEKHFVIKVPDGTTDDRYPKSKHVCWMDNVRPKIRSCVDTEDPQADKLLRKAARKFANPMIYSEATWEAFFQARRETPKMTVLMSGSKTHVSDYPDWLKEYEKIRDDDLRENAIFLESKVAAPVAKVFEQLGASNAPLPWVGAWVGPIDRQEFFLFEGVKEDMLDWFHQVLRGEIKPFYRAHKGWWHSIKQEFVVFGQVAGRAWRNAPWHQKCIVLGAIGVIFGGLWAINRFIPSDEEETVRAAERALREAQEKAAEQVAAAAAEGSEETIDDGGATEAKTVRQRK